MKKKNVTLLYSLITAGYWMGCVIYFQFAGGYLKALGYSATDYGLIIAAGSTLSAVLAPVLGSFCDKHPRITPLRINLPLYALQLVALLTLQFCFGQGACFLNTAAFILYITVCVPVNSVNMMMCVNFEKYGARLNFPLARGIGSLGFMVFCELAGILIADHTYSIIPLCGMLLILFDLPFHIWSEREMLRLRDQQPAEDAASQEKAVSLPRFIRDNKRFSLLLLGAVFIFVAHNLDANFLNEINTHLHGTPETLGRIGSITAIVEVPVLLFFVPIFGKMRESTLLKAAFGFFVLKLLAYALAAFAPTVDLYCWARILQAPSYAIFVAAIVPYVQKVISPRDAAKGQSLAFTVTTVGSVLAALFGGSLFDSIGVQSTLFVATGFAALGAVLAILGTQKTSANP